MWDMISVGKGVRGLGFAGSCNSLQHAREIAGHLVIGEPQHSQGVLTHDAVPFRVIALLFLVYRSVKFHNEAFAVAVEVHNEPIDHLLAAEVQPLELVAA